MRKRPFVTLEKVQEIIRTIPTPFHIYDEAGIRANARAVREAFSWNRGFREYFAVKATPNPYILKILSEEGCGCDCATYTELLLAEAVGITGHNVMFSSNTTTNAYYPELASKLFRLAVRMRNATGAHIAFVNLSGGIGVDYRPEQPSCDIRLIGQGVDSCWHPMEN